jgi:hypothetical protein
MPSSGALRRVALVFLRSVLRLLVPANIIPSSLIPFTMMTEPMHSSETSVPTITIERKVPEDGILQHSGMFMPAWRH